MEEAEEQMCDMIDGNVFTFSIKFYMNTECFCKYLKFIRSQYPQNQKIHLIIDKYSSHTNTLSKETAQNLNIELYYIPSH